MSSRIHALIVPFFITIMSLVYWVQISGARRSVILVPSGILALIAIFLVVVVVQEMRSPSPAPQYTFAGIRKPLILIVMFIAYYFLFNTIGFHLANLIFVFSAARLMNIPVLKAVITTVAATGVLYVLATQLNFTVPDPFWVR
jgi:hypothetical protein